MAGETYEERLDEALVVLTQAANQVSRHSVMGEVIERIGCTLSGRKSGWWPDKDGAQPVRDYSPSPQLEQSPYLFCPHHQAGDPLCQLAVETQERVA